ncbi:MAG: S8 family serine peptidase [Ignavibacteriae bacterium]|nr:S8 family serine peptidase [Ignavibacteriota bacterium]
MGPDFTDPIYNSDRSVRDNSGHGTHVTGIIAAETNNNIGIAGIAGGCKILVIQVFGSGGIPQSIFANGVIAAADSGARIINFSGGIGGNYQQARDAVQYANSRGTLLVVSTGNDGYVEYPARYSLEYSNVIAVGSTTKDDAVVWNSGKGTAVSVTAPGGDTNPFCPEIDPPGGCITVPDAVRIYSTFPPYLGQSFKWASGTSMAAPHVSGIAALILSAQPCLSVSDVRSIIESTADIKARLDGTYIMAMVV